MRKIHLRLPDKGYETKCGIKLKNNDFGYYHDLKGNPILYTEFRKFTTCRLCLRVAK